MLKKPLIYIIKLYQRFISPILGQRCRFFPTCSSYAIQAIDKYGVLHGVFLSIKRILKCHPLHPGGYNPLK